MTQSNLNIQGNKRTIEAKQICTFFVENMFLGIEVKKVQEVIRYQTTTPVPLSSPVISGLINLRGQIVTTIDMRRLFDLPNRSDAKAPMNVVVRSGDSVVSLLVDEIGDVVNVEDNLFEKPPETLGSQAKLLIHGVYKLDEQLLLLLNTDMATRGTELYVAEGREHGKR